MLDDIISKTNPYQNLGTEDIWREDDMFDQKDEKDISDFSREIFKKINENDPFLDFKVPTETIIDDIFNDDDMTDDENDNKVTIEDVTDDENETLLLKFLQSLTGIQKIQLCQLILDLEYITLANKIKNEYRRKIIGKKKDFKVEDSKFN